MTPQRFTTMSDTTSLTVSTVPDLSINGTHYILSSRHYDYAIAINGKLSEAVAEIAALRMDIANMNADYAALHQEMLLAREERTNTQIERDQYRALLARVLAVDEACTGDAYAALIADLRKVIGAK